LFPALHKSSDRDRVPPDLLKVHQELQKKNVTLFLLWQEYREQVSTLNPMVKAISNRHDLRILSN